jgi:hypothetical protein
MTEGAHGEPGVVEEGGQAKAAKKAGKRRRRRGEEIIALPRRQHQLGPQAPIGAVPRFSALP